LINIDSLIFGVNPTQWAFRFANPLLTEFLQIIYGLYYLVIPAYGIEVFMKKRYKDFNYSVFVLFIGFYLAYILYLIFPAVGPRFHLHDFYAIQAELPGLFLTEPIRAFLNFGESIPAGVTNPQDYVQRDAMPSLHAEVAILLAYLAKKLNMKSFYFYLPYCILMLVATIYLRYHYVIDLLAGALLAFIPILIGKLMYQLKDGEFIPKSIS
jgi:membrane-associated phospholipid phosphatase